MQVESSTVCSLATAKTDESSASKSSQERSNLVEKSTVTGQDHDDSPCDYYARCIMRVVVILLNIVSFLVSMQRLSNLLLIVYTLPLSDDRGWERIQLTAFVYAVYGIIRMGMMGCLVGIFGAIVESFWLVAMALGGHALVTILAVEFGWLGFALSALAVAAHTGLIHLMNNARTAIERVEGMKETVGPQKPRIALAWSVVVLNFVAGALFMPNLVLALGNVGVNPDMSFSEQLEACLTIAVPLIIMMGYLAGIYAALTSKVWLVAVALSAWLVASVLTDLCWQLGGFALCVVGVSAHIAMICQLKKTNTSIKRQPQTTTQEGRGAAHETKLLHDPEQAC